MDKDIVQSTLTCAAMTLPANDLVTIYIGGSFNTSYYRSESDIDLILIWKELPSLKIRQQFLRTLKTLFSDPNAKIYLDKDGGTYRDAAFISNTNRIEVYHYDMPGFDWILDGLDKEGLAYQNLLFSLQHRLPLRETTAMKNYFDCILAVALEHLVDARKHLKEKIDMSSSQRAKFHYWNQGLFVPAPKHWPTPLKMPPELIQQVGFTLQRYSAKHNRELFEIVDTERERLQEYLSWPKYIQALEDQNEFSVQASKQWEERKAFHFQIINSNQAVGGISIHTLDLNNKSFEFGYWIQSSHEGKGYIRMSLLKLIEEMRVLGWKEAFIRFDQTNTRSKAVAESISMTHSHHVEKSGRTYIYYRHSL